MAIDEDNIANVDEQDVAESTTGEEPSPEEAESEDLFADDIEAQQTLVKLYEKNRSENRYPRLVEVKDVKQQEYYWGSRQYIWWSTQDRQWSLPSQAQSSSYGDLNLEDMPRFEFVTNIYQARGLMMIAAVAGAPPRVRFFPTDADNEDDLETAESRTKLVKQIERWNPPSKLLQEETYHAWTGGFICWWSKYVKDARFGTDSVGLLQQSAQSEEGEEDYPSLEDGETVDQPRGRQEIRVFGALNCVRPQHVDHQSQYHFFGIEEEVHYTKLREENPDKEDEIKPGMSLGADDVFERNARLSVAENTKLLTQTGAASSNLCTLANVWFRKQAFFAIEDKSIRERIIAKAPKGCRVELTGTLYLKAAAENMDDAVVVCHAMPGRGQHRPSVGQSMLSLQDRVNTMSNIEMETYEYGIPITYRAADTFSSEANEDERAAPGLEVEVALRPDQNIQQRIMQVRADSVSPDMYQHNMDLQGPTADMISGTYPALNGSGEGAPDTLGQQSMQRDQAMGRMGIYYVNLKQAHADVMTISCKCFEQNANRSIKIPSISASGDFESDSVDVTALNGEAEAYPEGDETFPDLWNQQRATMSAVMDSPYGQQLTSEPENAELAAKLTGIPNLKVPGSDARRKQLREIAQLTKVPEGEDMLAGIAPMVDVDPDDYHQIESDTCKRWMASEKGQRVKRENPAGFMAVKEHKALHDKQIPPPEQPEKPLSKTATVNLKDMPPEAQAQWLAKEFGIQVGPQDFVQAAMLDHFKKSFGKPATGNEAAGPARETAKQPVPAGGGV